MTALHALQKLSEENGQLRDEITSLKNRIAWFEKQIFGQKSEKRVIENPHQASLLSEPTETEIEAAPEKDVQLLRLGLRISAYALDGTWIILFNYWDWHSAIALLNP